MPVKVMVVDDSAVVRGLISRTLQQDPEIEVVTSASNGRMAILELAKHEIDVIILDIEMPIMDGMTALPQLIEQKPGIKIIMASTLTLRNADISLQALSQGAVDYIAKPSTSEGPQAAQRFREALRDMVKVYGGQARSEGRIASRPAVDAPARPAGLLSRPSAAPGGAITLRAEPSGPLSALAIASSTGGPQAIFRMMEDLKHSLAQTPVFITQHMPPTFTRMLASHIERIAPLKSVEAEDDMPVEGGMIYVAPGGFHMVLAQLNGGRKVKLTSDPPVNFCRPSADPMLKSLADAYGTKLAIVVLTGMGSDGLDGCRYAVDKGASVMAQDEATSVVWGMPGAVARAGICSAVLPIDQLGPRIRNRLRK